MSAIFSGQANQEGRSGRQVRHQVRCFPQEDRQKDGNHSALQVCLLVLWQGKNSYRFRPQDRLSSQLGSFSGDHEASSRRYLELQEQELPHQGCRRCLDLFHHSRCLSPIRHQEVEGDEGAVSVWFVISINKRKNQRQRRSLPLLLPSGLDLHFERVRTDGQAVLGLTYIGVHGLGRGCQSERAEQVGKEQKQLGPGQGLAHALSSSCSEEVEWLHVSGSCTAPEISLRIKVKRIWIVSGIDSSTEEERKHWGS